MTRLDKKFNVQLPIWNEYKSVKKELLQKYLPLYDLKMNSQMEDIEVRYSLADVAKE